MSERLRAHDEPRMMDERALVLRLESAGAAELVEMLVHSTPDEELALRAHLGHELLAHLRILALRAAPQRGRGQPSGRNVVFLHDFMGGTLTGSRPGRPEQLLWMAPALLANGDFARLRLEPNGRDSIDSEVIRPGGARKLLYAELILALAERWSVLAFAYDWRKHVRVVVSDLEAAITSWIGTEQPFHIVTHGSGAFLAREFMEQFGDRWARSGRLVMLGPPSHGTFVALQLLTGIADLSRALEAVDSRHSPHELAAILGSFPGLYLLLPEAQTGLEELYDAAKYPARAGVVQHHLEDAKHFHEKLKWTSSPERTTLVLGTGQRTAVRVNVARLRAIDPGKPREALDAFTFADGDGVVPLAPAESSGSRAGWTTYRVATRHDLLPSHPDVLGALDSLLSGPQAASSSVRLSVAASSGVAYSEGPSEKEEHEKEIEDWTAHLAGQALRLRRRDVLSHGEAYLTTEEREIETISLCGKRPPPEGSTVALDGHRPEPPRVKMRVIKGDITREILTNGSPVDAIAVGQYEGTPLGPVLVALDEAIGSVSGRPDGSPARGVMAHLLGRGVAGQRVGQLFWVPDPRPGANRRLIVVAGMGAFGKFGAPEATRMMCELGVALGEMGKTHLAMVLIGGGEGNLPVRDVVASLVRGVKEALRVLGDRGLREITFVESDPARVALILQALDAERILRAAERQLIIDIEPKLTEATAADKRDAGLQDARSTPTRITVVREETSYKFSALTETASVPERVVDADPALIAEANDGLVRAATIHEQREWGQVLGKLLLPADLRGEIFSGRPLVLILDDSTAHIHWEMVAQPDNTYWSTPREILASAGKETGVVDPYTGVFLGIGRGLTRQLRTAHAPCLEPLVPPKRLLRVLVVADPAPDASLVGAQEEGAAVADLFERYGQLQASAGGANQVEVIRLFGGDATRSAVLRMLMLRTIDVLHFAGHCGRADVNDDYGWIFQRATMERITRREIARLDRVPGFVFSNACESGITPGRSDRRSADMAPNFAKSFFAGGVSNFVCTAWPIGDDDACRFALVFYSTLLGLVPPTRASDIASTTPAGEGPQDIQFAMRRARESIATSSRRKDARTWGAYQHYGSPAFRLFRSEAAEG